MTLVLAYGNPDFLVMAADRRITRGTKVEDDKRTKIISWGNKALLGFSGLAELGQERIYTLEWLSSEIAKQGNNFNAYHIAKSLEKIVSKSPGKKDAKRLEILFVGYDDEAKISFGLISNCRSELGELLNYANSSFWVSFEPIEGRLSIRTIGQFIPQTVQERTLERLRKTHCTDLPSEKVIKEILAGAIQDSAGKYVSKICLVVTARCKGGGTFDVITPKSKQGQTVDLASPYLVMPGTVMHMPSQSMKRSKVSK